MSELPQVAGLYDPELAKVRVARLAARQCGVVARRQLALLGVSDTQIRRWTAGGYLIRRLPGVYAVGHAAPSVAAELTAALLYAGPGAMLTSATGVWWLELSDRRPDDVQLISPRRRRTFAGIVIRTRDGLTRGWHRNLPVAPVAQVLLDYAITVADLDLRRALAQAEYHGYLDVDLLRAELGRGRPGSARLREALAQHDPRLARTRSELETAFLALCRAHNLPAPELNVTVEGHLVDMLWREQRVIVELDGAANHRHWGQIQRDRGRDLDLRAAGYIVLRYVWAQVIGQPAAVAQDVRAALARPQLG
jgi:very-short-patch-repair endonuclease